MLISLIIALTLILSGCSSNTVEPQTKLYIDNVVVHMLVPQYGSTYPVYSPNGERVLFSYGNNLLSLSLQSRDITNLTSGDVGELDCVFMGDNIGFISNYNNEHYSLWQYNDDFFHIPEKIWSTDLNIGSWDYCDFDGRIAYSIFDPSTNSSNIYLLEDNVSRVLIGSPNVICGRPNFSPDGTKLLYQTNQSGNFDIWLYDFESGDSSPLVTFAGNEADPVWSPDGNYLVFRSDLSGSYELWIGTLDGKELSQLISGYGDCFYPDWSPNKNAIVFASNYAVNEFRIFEVTFDLK